MNRWMKRALLGSLIVASAALSGCYYPPYGPYGYGPRYGYAPGSAYYHPYYYR